MIPVFSSTRQTEQIRAQLDQAIDRVIRSGQYINGPEVDSFENELADYLGTPFVIGLNSGTDALVIALRVLDIGPGDEVIVPAMSFFATSESVLSVGAKAIFVDIDPKTRCISLDQIESVITPRTKAIIPVHLYGHPVDMNRLMTIAEKHNLKVIEDCAQSMGGHFNGKKLGTIGEIGTYSFFPTKNLGAFGDGGALVTANEACAKRAKALRMHGALKKYFNEEVGYNSRLDALQAAILRVKLPYLPSWNQSRIEIAKQYESLLGKHPKLQLPEIVPGHVFHQYTVLLDPSLNRDAVKESLKTTGVDTMVYYPVPLHQLKPHLQDAKAQKNNGVALVHAENIASRSISLPMWPELTENEVRTVCERLQQVLG